MRKGKPLELSSVVTIVVPALGGIVWLLRLEGRINAHDLEHREHARRYAEMREDLAYIRQRIDKALNGHA
jgi:hypothetical protein